MLVRPHELIADALQGRFGIGAFNTSNLEVTQAIVAAAQEQRAPVVVQTSEGAINYAGLKVLSGIIKSLAEEVTVPVVMHLDHGKNLDVVRRCIAAGYTSVMIDVSDKPLLENISLVREVVEFAHERRVWVEAELGTILGAEGAKELAGERTPDEHLTDAREVGEYVRQTGVDALAVSVGTIHGAFTGQEYIRFALLEQIGQQVPHLPLVIHGASGIAAKQLKRAAASQVCKINVDTELRLAFEEAIKSYFGEPHDKIDPRRMLGPAREAVQIVVQDKMKLFGSAGKA